MTDASGCMSWQPPEVLNGAKRSSSMDIFSLGCVFYYVLSCGSHPFTNKQSNVQNTLTNILQNKSDISSIMSFPEAYDLISRMISAYREQRPSMDDVLSHCMFWDNEKKLRFIMDFSDHLEFLNQAHPTVK